MFTKTVISNPKRSAKAYNGRSNWYPYYAGYSYDFASSVISTTGIPHNARILDPWNGSGTTTTAASSHGYRSVGFDLNPVMVIAARAGMLNHNQLPSLKPIAADILTKARQNNDFDTLDNDALNRWFTNSSTLSIRRVEAAIQRLLVDENQYTPFIQYPRQIMPGWARQ